MQSFDLLGKAILAAAAFATLAECQAANDESALAGSCKVEVGEDGALMVRAGDESFRVVSSYSFPGDAIGRHWLGRNGSESDAWRPVIAHGADGAYIVTARGPYYTLRRTINQTGHRIVVRERLTSVSDKDVGVLIDHKFEPGTRPQEVRIGGAVAESGSAAENPTIFLRCSRSSLGFLAEDNVSRVQFFATTDGASATYQLRNLALRPGESLTLEWSLYPSDANTDYFGFVNRIREDLGVNRTIPGPGGWFDATKSPLWSAWKDPAELKAVLDRNRLKVVLTAPWLDYENVHRQTGKLIWRDEYKELMRQAISALHDIDPEIRVLACLEAPFVGLPQSLVDDLYAAVPEPKQQGYHDMTAEMLAIFQRHPEAWRRWRDSLVFNRAGQSKFELYYREGLPLIALTVRPVIGNGQHAYLMEQARFVIEEVGFDGYYIDSFTGAQHPYYGYSYDQWDGRTVDISPETGEIVARYTDLALAGAGSRREVIQYGLGQGKMVLVNGHPITRDTQSLGHLAFNESEWVFEPLAWLDDKPPWQQRPCEGHLSTPLALGFRPGRAGEEGAAHYAQILMKGAIAYLRHGILYFHYAMDMPLSGPGSGTFEPFNHMFPITPVRLGEGFVEGRERIVTAVSRRFDWPHDRRPVVRLYDEAGRPADRPIEPTRRKSGWEVFIQLDDWKNIAVIE